MNDGYQATPQERWMIGCLQGIIGGILNGDSRAVGICASDSNGNPTFVYYEHPDAPNASLREPMSRLMGLYEIQHREFSKRINAPRDNRSYRAH